MNLKDYYTEADVKFLLDYIPENIETIKIGTDTFYLRQSINDILEEGVKQNPGSIYLVREKILGIPAYDLDLNEWIEYATALEMFPLSHQRLIEGKDTYDKLKIIRTQTVYDRLFYNVRDINYYISLDPPTAYYDISYNEAQTINNENMTNPYVVPTDKNLLAAWYTPKEMAIVLGFPRKNLWYWMLARDKNKDMPTRRKFSRAYIYYIPEVHEWCENNEYSQGSYKTFGWHSRWIYLAEHRITDARFDEWVCLGQVNDLIDYSRVSFHKQKRENNWGEFDYGGIRVYSKEPIREFMLTMPKRGKTTFPMTSNTGIHYKTEEEWLRAVREW